MPIEKHISWPYRIVLLCKTSEGPVNHNSRAANFWLGRIDFATTKNAKIINITN